MPVPDYQTLMLPSLTALQGGEPRSVGHVRQIVAAQLELGENDLRETIKSGARVFDNRVHWALTYMVQAGLARRPRRGQVEITERGREVLQQHPRRIDNSILSTFEDFQEFKNRARARQAGSTAREVHDGQPMVSATPREVITAAVEETNGAVAADLLVRIREQDPDFLERLVLKLLTAMGYGGAAGSAEHLGRSGDEGLDGVIRQDSLGLDRIYVQAKRYAADRSIGRPDIQGFVGALHGAQADRGVFITTSRFSQEAHGYADKVAARIILIDGPALAGLLVEHNVGVQDDEAFVLKRVDEDFFEE